ncbi:hypothetical protein HMPREF3213_01456 [Heyndrickxia coagulans]|uniref:Uncharacterized protein n=1 Tax=Heyndrickxia coagulans TaxID=1398 RepID=A0A133KTQ7_HEYCO|nr:hypothetical protein HMPREF3213_01456 [Heyndrickxia coagulans]
MRSLPLRRSNHSKFSLCSGVPAMPCFMAGQNRFFVYYLYRMFPAVFNIRRFKISL